jgi:hypothetical protein
MKTSESRMQWSRAKRMTYQVFIVSDYLRIGMYA